MTNHIVYILGCKDGTYYTGYTNNFDKRLKAHEAGKGAKYTRGRGPFQVLHKESYSTKEEAMSREAKIKQLRRADKEQLIKKVNTSGAKEF
ncbi:MAG TPA: GIY-YIG nuclease family protein [Candidatus Angelobacter sp.]|nr:GIY-YIG nuclease family protein [Candidatus Angelobacter sp.]